VAPGAALARRGLTGRTPLLDRIRARVSDDRGRDEPGPYAETTALLEAFAMTPDDPAAPPVAALSALGDGLHGGEGFWLRADPVCLQPSGADLLLLPPSTLELGTDEADDLLEAIRSGLGCADGRWYRGEDPRRWYLAAGSVVNARFLPPDYCAGQGLDRCLPTGPAAADWIRRMNEIQMILHEHPVNEHREAQGAPAVNSVWFWGAGALPVPPPPGARGWDHVCSDEPVARGLARLCSIPSRSLPPDADTLLAASDTTGRVLVVLARALLRTSRADDDGCPWLERDWLEPSCEAVLDGKLQSLTVVDPDMGTLPVRRGDLMPWWRRWLQ
jgi:hypothetical protein